jgi:hypothetical protein
LAEKNTKKPSSEKSLALIEELLTKELDPAQTDKDEPIDPLALARGDKPMTIVAHLDELRSRI